MLKSILTGGKAADFARAFPTLLLAILLTAASGLVSLRPADAVPDRDASETSKESEGAEADWLEAYTYLYNQRAFPSGKIDPTALARATAVRDQLPATPLRTGPRGTRLAGSGWQFLGPSNLPVPYQKYYGQGTTSGRVTGVAFHPTVPTTYFISTAGGGCWRTTDGGRNWTPLSDAWTNTLTGSVAVDPTDGNKVYVGTGDLYGAAGSATAGYGVMRSTDGGGSWTRVGAALSGSTVTRIVVDPETPSIITASTGGDYATTTGFVWRSTDGGNTWNKVITTGSRWQDVAIGAVDTAGKRNYYAVGNSFGGEVWRSSNRGSTWQKLTTPLNANTFELGTRIAASPRDPSTVYLLAATERKIFKSTDAGATWTDITAGFPNDDQQGDNYNWSQYFYDTSICCSTRADTNKDVIYVGLIDVVQSPDAGATWRSVGKTYQDTALTHNDQHACAIDPKNPNRALIGNDGGVYLMTFSPSADSVTFDTSLNQTLGVSQFYCADIHPTDPTRMLGGTQDNATPVSVGDFQNWTNKGGGDGGFCAVHPVNPNVQYATSQGLTVYRTADGWGTEVVISPNIGSDAVAFIAPIAINPKQPNLLYAGTNFLYQYDDTTSTWTAHLGSQQLAGTNAYLTTIAVAPSDAKRIYTGSSDGQVWTSGDGGQSWTEIDTGTPGLPKRAIACIAVHPTKANTVLVSVSGTGSGHVFRCDDTLGTRRWVNAGGGLPDISANAVLFNPASPDTIYHVGTDVGAFTSIDAGASFTNTTGSIGLPNVGVTSLRANTATGYLVAATYGRGMWRIKYTDIKGSISVTSPNGGEALFVGSRAHISWKTTLQLPTANVRLELSRDGGLSYELITSSTPNTGGYDWVVTGPVSAGALIRATMVADPSVTDISDSSFSIVDGSLTVTSPNGGEAAIIGRTQTIQWTTSGFASQFPTVKVELSRNDGITWETLFATTPNTGSVDWPVKGAATDQALVRVSTIATTAAPFPISDTSDADFEIRVPSTITVTAPNGGEVLSVGSVAHLTWTWQGFVDTVRVDLSRDSGRTWTTLFNEVDNSGSVDWTVTGPGTKSARLRVVSTTNDPNFQNVQGISSGNFTVLVPSITVTSPVSGYTMLTGSAQTVTYTAVGIPSSQNVKLDYSVAGGAYQPLVTSASNTGTLTFTVPSQPSVNVTLRVSTVVQNAGDVDVAGQSGTLVIAAPTIALTTPNGKEQWQLGTQQIINWSGTTLGHGNVNIELSRDGGVSWAPILVGVPNNGGAAWGVSGALTKKAQVRITWVGSAAVTSKSHASFQIVKGKLPR